ncbi:MAG TPA: uroporphyrinogen-III synthase [Fimbriimonadaceae bacterium]|nr:uroporphyrinogen-III synthase [Fimbriimonadaceae bacterium]
MKHLEGRSVLVTRPRQQAEGLVAELESLGATVFTMPVIEILPPESMSPVDAALTNLDVYDWVVLTSVNGVKAVAMRMGELGIPVEKLRHKRLAAIGPATGEALERFVRKPDLIPEQYVSEAIAAGLGNVHGMHFLLARADIARRDLAELLRQGGARVDEVAVYRIVRGEGPVSLPDQAPDYITLTSSSAARGTFEILREKGRAGWMTESALVCIGPITAGTVRELGFEVAVEAEEYTVPGLVKALVEHAEKESIHA